MHQDSQLVKDKEFEFMLSELGEERKLIDERHRRFEQIVAYYLTFIAALVAATTAIITGASGITITIILLLTCLLLSISGHAVWLTLIAIKSAIVASQSHFYMRRQYFLDAFPPVKPYVEFRNSEEIQQVSKAHFGKTTLFLFFLFAFLNVLLLAVFVSAASYLLIDQFGRVNPFVVAIPFGIFVIVLFLAFEVWLLKQRTKSAHSYSRRIFSSFHQEDDKAGISEASNSDLPPNAQGKVEIDTEKMQMLD